MSDPHNHAPAVVPIAELARSAGVTSETLIAAARRGELAVTRVGRRYYTTAAVIKEYLTPRRLTEAQPT